MLTPLSRSIYTSLPLDFTCHVIRASHVVCHVVCQSHVGNLLVLSTELFAWGLLVSFSYFYRNVTTEAAFVLLPCVVLGS